MDVQELPALEGMPEELANRIRRMVVDNANGIQGGMKFELGLEQNGIRAQRQATFRMIYNDEPIELKSTDDSKEVTVRDKYNNVIWNGPWDTEHDKTAAPEDIRQRIERLNIDQNGDGIRSNARPNR
jgi:hypothetical protein